MRWMAVWVALCVLMAPAGAVVAQDQTVTVTFKGPRSVELPLTQGPDAKLYLKVISHGQELSMIVDTGGATLLDLDTAKALGLELHESPTLAYGLVGPSNEKFQSYADFAFGKLQVFNIPVAIVNMSEPKKLSREHGHPEFHGIIGAELLAAFEGRIDYGKRTLKLTQP
jgi:hypothetical protein